MCPNLSVSQCYAGYCFIIGPSAIQKISLTQEQFHFEQNLLIIMMLMLCSILLLCVLPIMHWEQRVLKEKSVNLARFYIYIIARGYICLSPSTVEFLILIGQKEFITGLCQCASSNIILIATAYINIT